MNLSIILTLLKLALWVVQALERAKLKAEGKAEAYAEQKAKNDALQVHYDQIDAGPRDLDVSIGRLRARAAAKSAGDKSPPAP